MIAETTKMLLTGGCLGLFIGLVLGVVAGALLTHRSWLKSGRKLQREFSPPKAPASFKDVLNG